MASRWGALHGPGAQQRPGATTHGAEPRRAFSQSPKGAPPAPGAPCFLGGQREKGAWLFRLFSSTSGIF